MSKKILLGTIALERDTVLMNTSFQYAASFEELKVEKGEYPIYTYASDLRKTRDGILEVDCAYFGFEGTVLRGNVGGKPGDHTYYSTYVRGYDLAQYVLDGHKYFNKIDRATIELRAEWELKVSDFISSYDNKRVFCLDVVLKEDAEIEYTK